MSFINPGTWIRLARGIAATFVLLAAVSTTPAMAQSPDLPGAPPNIETIESGSLVIAMDQTLQPHAGTIFNLKAYGLANHLLQNNVPLKWAIRSGKAKDGIDFSANTTLLLPAAGATSVRNFSGGPLIVAKPFVAQATTLINNFNNALAAADQVDVYRLNADTSIDIRYTLTFKPFVGINTVNSNIHSTIFDQASFPNYIVADISTITATACLTMHTEPHNEGAAVADIDRVRNFVLSGGNFFAQCASTEYFEEFGMAGGVGRFQSATGVTRDNIAAILSYPNPDLAFSQYVNILNGSIGGSHRDWTINSTFANNGHSHALNTTTGVTRHAATQSKLITGVGGNTFYLGGHEYNGTTIGDINGRRMLLNAALVPANRPSCGLSFASVTGFVFYDANNNGVQDSGEPPLAGVTVTITSSGGGGPITVTTDVDGNYAASVAPGTVTATVTPLPTYAVTTNNTTQTFNVANGGVVTATDVGLSNLARVAITKISQDDVGTFGFTGNNGWVAQNITTVSVGVGVTGATQTLTTAGVATTLTESTLPANFALGAVSCTGLGAGGIATPDLANRNVLLNAAATAPGSNITCTFTNRRKRADLTLTKTNTPGLNGEVDQAADTVVSGAITTYTIVVSNAGPDGVDNAVITDPAPSGATCTTATCAATGGATCPVEAGAALVTALQGAGATVPTLPNGGVVTTTMTCTVN